MFANINRYIILLILSVSAALTFASPSSAYSAAQEESIIASGQAKMNDNLFRLGTHVAIARECGIPDSQMPGHLAAYQTHFTIIRAVQASGEFTPAQKAEFGSEASATAQFFAGESKIVHIGPVKPEVCTMVKASWLKDDQEMAAWATRTSLELSKVKDPKVAAFANFK